jgi:hypothetical protein
LLQSLFALLIKNSFGRRRDFRVKMWGTSSPEDKLTGDLGNVIEEAAPDFQRNESLSGVDSTTATLLPFGGAEAVAALNEGKVDVRVDCRSAGCTDSSP